MNAVDIFCGAGGSSLGIERAGFKVEFALDVSKSKCRTFKANFPGTEVIRADALTFDSFPCADLYSFSPPCTEISTANTGKNKDIEKGLSLVRRSLEIIAKVKPKWWWIENVPYLTHFLKMKHYELNAADFGVPQIRRRVFFTNIPRPVQTHAEFPHDAHFFHEGPALKKWISVREALAIEEGSQGNGFNLQERHNSTPNRRSLDEHSYAVLTNRTNYLLAWNGPSKTITATEGKWAKGDRRRAGRIAGRALTPEECAVLQGFPKDFQFLGTKAERYLQIGDGVCPPVAEALARSAFKAE